MRLAVALRLAPLAAAGALAWLLLLGLLGKRPPSPGGTLLGRAERPTAGPRPFRPRFRCGLPRPCPPSSLAFRLVSGAANVIGPRICLDGRMLMSSGQNNVGRGLNIALVNGVTGALIAARAFDMWAGEAEELLRFLRPLQEGTLVLAASFDDAATKCANLCRLTPESRRILADLGSAAAPTLGFRDSWVFVGAKGVQDKSPFEQHVRNSRSSNKYEGWPEALSMDGCVPRRPLH